LRKGGAQHARAVGYAARIEGEGRSVTTGDVTEFMYDRTLLRRNQQQHESQCSVHVSHRYSGLARRRNLNSLK
jgi:hypothetical protein